MAASLFQPVKLEIKKGLASAYVLKNILGLITASIVKDAVTLFICKKENLRDNLSTEHNKEDVFLDTDLRNQKKTLEKFEKHQASMCHRSATTHKVVIPRCGNVKEMIDS